MTYGLPFANAETLVPALLVNQALLAASGADRMMVAGVSMRDGLLLDLTNQLAGREDPVLAESVLQSARTIGEKYGYDAGHAELVAELSVRLFDELARDHGLAARQRLLLQAAAVLHEIGSFVSSRAHHKHSYYLIVNSEIFGLRQWERQIVALVARYHRRATPRLTHEEYRTLPRTPRLQINRLAAILRVADALAGGQGQQMLKFRAERRDDDLVLGVPGVTDFSAEERALAKKADLFEDVYGMKVRLETAEAGS
jgi:exopolyphosphatase/guanosine-5'-triphosphate,3'-diphosphate pyrophosphatase